MAKYIQPNEIYIVESIYDFINYYIFKDKCSTELKIAYDKFIKEVKKQVSIDDLELDEDEDEEDIQIELIDEYFAKNKIEGLLTIDAFIELLQYLPDNYSFCVIKDGYDNSFTILIFK